MESNDQIDIPDQGVDYRLRTHDGQEYGPAGLAELQAWCREGRIEPDQMVSSQTGDWIPVTDMPELELDWLLVLADGTEAGPFHLAMLEDQHQAGNIPAGASLQHKQTGETRELYPPEPGQSPPAESEQVNDASPLPETDATATDATAAAAPPREEPVSQRLETLTQHAATARNQLAETRTTLQDLRTRHSLLQDQQQHLQDQLATSEMERDAAEKGLLELQNQTAQHLSEIDNLTSQYEQIREHYESLQLENQRQFEQIDDLRAQALDQQQHGERDIAILHAALATKNRILSELTGILSQDPDLVALLPMGAAEPPETEAQTAPQAQPPIVAADPARLPRTRRPDPTDHPTPQDTPPPRPRFRLPLGVLVVAASGLLLLILVHCSSSQRDGAPEIAPADETLAMDTPRQSPREADPVIVPEAALTLPPEPQVRPDNGNPVPARPWPNLQLPRSSVTIEPNAMRITFDYGLFASGTRLQQQARTDLLQLARQLQKQLDGFTLIIEGHTDEVPVSAANEQFVDNFALGMARAEIVKQFLQEQAGMASSRIRTASAGQSSPPYPNDTTENQARNRTAVITIIQ